ncbi:CTR2 short splice [Pleurostoma richardsiae]|uniref:Copper transport protein n=1 Tax=Pleurostoma richardsiae TaxID=41990 RepID=A0AA38S2S9_9PEZI|nr:CTR2 short splice [Pleurostoma richardsiae]
MDSHMDHAHHTGMDHGGMDHGMGDRCSMNMLFTWNTNNLCIVFSQWHIRSTAGLLLSLLAVVALGAGYEALRAGIRRYELAVSRRVEAIPRQNQGQVSKRAHVIKSLLYAVQTFYAFMIMLIFMTYNGWVMLSVTVGAFVGYLLFGNTTTAAKETACH